MASNDQFHFGPWPKGINNRKAEHELDGDEARDAVNVDFTNTGRARRRRGARQLFSGTGETHSLFAFGQTVLYVDGTQLKLSTTGISGTFSTVRSDLVLGRPVNYVEANGDIYYSNGLVTGMIKAGYGAVPWGVDESNPLPNVVTLGTGGYPAGKYIVAFVSVAPWGEESGAHPRSYDVPEGGGLTVVFPQVLTVGYRWRVYLSSTNDQHLYQHSDYAYNTLTANLGYQSNRGRILETGLRDVFPPCDRLAYFNGRIYGSQGSWLWYTEPLRYGLVDYSQNFVLFPAEISIIAPVRDGIYIASDRTYFLGGHSPNDFTRREVLPYGAAPRSAVRIGNTTMMGWFTKHGYVIGADGGEVKAVADDRIAAPEYRRGAALFREDRGIRQLVGSFPTEVTSTFAATDIADVEIIRGA